MYLWTKIFHLLFVIAWMAAVFYLPRILINLSETRGDEPVTARLQLMGMRLYRFGHVMFGIMLALGLPLWLGFRVAPQWWPPVAASGGWMHAKLTLVVVLLVYYIVSGRLLKRSMAGGELPSSTWLRWFNEAPLLLIVPIIWLVLAKPF
jgi:putative membrane protein